MNISDTLRQSASLAAEIKTSFKSEQWFDCELTFEHQTMRIVSNQQSVLSRLRDYFSDFICKDKSHPSSHVIYVFEQPNAKMLEVSWQDWQREVGKSGRKDAYYDLADGRLIQKVRTGMQFLQHPTEKLAWGPCLDNLNQVINYINNQYMNRLQQNDWLICHASACLINEQAIAFAGYSGGGKSTIMLHLMNQHAASFVSNDRLFLKQLNNQVAVAGIPKSPRVNPGTILHNPALTKMLTRQQAKHYAAMDEDELWYLEEKFDVDVSQVFGENRVRLQAPLKALYILNWSHQSTSDTQIEAIDIYQKKHLLKAVMKSPGPFYQDAKHQFIDDNFAPLETAYLEKLKDITIYEVSGHADFDSLRAHCVREQ